MKKSKIHLQIWTVILMAVFLLIPGFTSSAESHPESIPFDIEIQYGFEDTVRIGRDVSFQVKLVNKGDAFEGTIGLMTASYKEDGYYYSSVTGLPFLSSAGIRYYDNCVYEKGLSISSGGRQVVRFALPFDSCAPFIKVIITNSSGEIVTEKIIRLSIRTSYSEILLGALTGRPQELEYLDGIHLENYAGVSISQVMVDPEQLQNHHYGLDMLDVLLVHAYDTSCLSQEQQKAIEKWVRQGGTLVIDEWQETSETKKLYGNGQILFWTESFDGEACSQTERNHKVSVLMEEIYTTENLTYMDSGTYYFTSEEYWDVMGRVSSIHKENISEMPGYAIVLGVYILLSGPIVYLILKKLRVRKYLWGCVAVLAAIFSAIVFIMGSDTRFTAPFINYVRTLELENGYEDDRIEFSVRAPYNHEYTVYVNNSYDVFPVSEIDYYSAEKLPEADFGKESVRIRYGKEENELHIESQPSFTEKYFRAEKSMQRDKEAVQGMLNYFDSELTGALVNNTGYDLTNTFIFFRNHLVYIGDFPADTSVDMKEYKMYFFSPGYGYKLLRGILEIPEGYVKEITDEYLDISWKNTLLNEYLIEGYHSGEERCMLVGFTTDVPMDLMNDTAYKMYGQTMVTNNLKLEMTRKTGGKEWKYDPFVTSTAKVVSGNYGAYENVCYSQETVLEFTLPAELQNMEVEFVDEEYFDAESYRAFGGEIEVYHPRKESYEKLTEKGKINKAELMECITEDGTLLVKFRRKSESQDKFEKLPVVIARGRKIHAED